LFASDTLPDSILHDLGDWKYTDWQIVELDTSKYEGHT